VAAVPQPGSHSRAPESGGHAWLERPALRSWRCARGVLRGCAGDAVRVCIGVCGGCCAGAVGVQWGVCGGCFAGVGGVREDAVRVCSGVCVGGCFTGAVGTCSLGRGGHTSVRCLALQPGEALLAGAAPPGFGASVAPQEQWRGKGWLLRGDTPRSWKTD